MTETTTQERPYLATPICREMNMLMSDEIRELRSGINARAIGQAAGLGMWIGNGIRESFPDASVEELHEGLGHALPVLEVAPEVAAVVYQEAMGTFLRNSGGNQ